MSTNKIATTDDAASRIPIIQGYLDNFPMGTPPAIAQLLKDMLTTQLFLVKIAAGQIVAPTIKQ